MCEQQFHGEDCVTFSHVAAARSARRVSKFWGVAGLDFRHI
jgi:hypothetical protein